MLLRYSLIAAVVVFSTLSSHAGVSLRNGNFYIGFNDIEYTGGMGLKFERTCNSKTRDHRGLVGMCWGNEFETRIAVSPDGSLTVKEFGGGAENVFVLRHSKRKTWTRLSFRPFKVSREPAFR